MFKTRTKVQDPDEAEFPWMPRSALRYVQVDQCVPLAEIPSVLLRLIDEPAPEGEAEPVPKEMEFEANIAEQQMNTQEFLDNVEQIGIRTSYTCPACSGSIWQIGNENPLRFRCHVGHSFTAEPFLAEQTSHIEDVLWAAVRALEEKVTLMRQLAQRMKQQGNSSVAIRYEDYAQKIDGEVSIVRELILNGFATKRNVVAGEK
jgi:two-component system chemotaxis response regulator CheB